MSRGKGTRGFRVLALTAAVGLATASFASVPVLLAATASPATATVSGSLAATASSSWQTNSEVRQMAYSDGRVWLVGSFTAMRPPGYRLGHHETDATYFAALDAATGALDTAVDHTHTFTGGGYQGADEAFAVAASPDGDTVYVGGNFTAVDGYSRPHIAAFSATTGALLPWSPTVDGKVSAIATSGQSVYIGGTFSTVDGSARANLAAVSASTADLVPGWAPTTNDTVDALAVTSDDATVVAGGYFDQVDGQTSSGTTTYNKAVLLAGVTSSDPGTPLPMPADAVVPPGMPQAPVHDCDSNVKDVVISSGVAYFANEGTGDGCFDGTWAASLSSGQLVWVNRCLGATQAVAVVGDYLYKGSHAHNCQQTNTNHDPANFPQVAPGGARHLLSEKLSNGFLGPWYPLMNAGPDLGPRTMATDGQQLYVGGDFTTVNRTGQQGIARFRTAPDYPTPMSDAPVVTSVLPGRVTVSAKPPVDLDNPQLTMELFVAGTSHPIRSTVVTSYFWKQPTVHWVDRDLREDSKQVFRVRAVAPGEQPGAKSVPVAVHVACAAGGRVGATLRSVTALKGKRGVRRLDLRLCVGRRVSARLQLRRGDQVVVGKSRRLGRGIATVRLAVPRHARAGRYRLHAVFARGSERHTENKTVRLPG